MCGFAGTAGFADEALIDAMTSAVRHRGPDDSGTFISSDRQVSLGSRRLAILDLSPNGHMPMATPDGALHLVYNGEIYNFREVRAELEAMGYTFRSDGDTEVILHGYDAWKLGVLPRLKGMFAFALWDARRRELVLARDPYGIKPLYYTARGSKFVFGSEIKSLMCWADAATDLDPAAVWSYLVHTWVPGPETVLAGVKRLQPGHVLVWTEHRALEISRYHTLQAPRSDRGDEREDVAEFQRLFDASVKRHLISDVPLGVFVSGGLDSTAILDSASRATSTPIDAYTIEYQATDGRWEQSDEDAKYAAIVAQHYGAKHHRIVLNPDVASLLPIVAAHMDEPVADTAAVSALLICRAAKPEVTVMLSGMGADETMAGYSFHHAFGASAALGRVPKLVREGLARPALQALGLARHLPTSLRPGFWLALQRYGGTLLDSAGTSAEEVYLAYRHWGGRPDRTLALLAAPLRAAAVARLPDVRQREVFEETRGQDTLSQVLATEIRTYLPDLNLLYSDKMSMAASVELRVPFLDRDLMDFICSLPPDRKLRGHDTKWILRRASAGRVPAAVLQRRKAPFASPMRRWLRTDLRPMTEDLLAPDRLRRQGIFDPAAVGQVMQAYFAGQHDNVHLMYGLVHFQLWHDAVISMRTSRVAA